MRIIAVCGMPGSGKGEVAEVARSRGYPVHSMGDVVRRFFASECTGRDPIETGIYADMERKKHGKDVWAKRLIETLEGELTADTEIVMIDGLRSSMEATLFKKRWGSYFRILAVHSSPDTRYQRLVERKRGDDSPDRKKFDERDERELGWGLGDVISRADLMLLNEGGLDGFRSDVMEFFDRMEEGP